MKLIINASSVFKGGAEQVLISFLNECKTINEHTYYVFLRDNIISQLNIDQFPNNFIFTRVEYRPASGILNYFKTIKTFNRLEKEINPDCVISTGGHGYWRSKAPLVAGFNIPHFVYPESPFFEKISLLEKLFWRLKKAVNLYYYDRADALFVQTLDVKERLQKLLPGKPVYVVSNTVNGYFLEDYRGDRKLPPPDKDELRLLTVSSFYPHKNIEIIKGIIKELSLLKYNNIKFVLTLPDDIYRSMFNETERKCIYNIGPIPIIECPALYRECDFMFLPTLLECFSASFAEAMAMKKPILTSDLGFAHAVCGNAAVYFDPLDEKNIAEKIVGLMRDKVKQEELIRAGENRLKSCGTAKDRAIDFLSICKQMAENGKKN